MKITTRLALIWSQLWGNNDSETQAAMEAYNESDYTNSARALHELRTHNGVTGLDIYEIVSYRKNG